jgi:hypothetical protein
VHQLVRSRLAARAWPSLSGGDARPWPLPTSAQRRLPDLGASTCRLDAPRTGPSRPSLAVPATAATTTPTTRTSSQTARRSSLLSAVCFIGVLAARSMGPAVRIGRQRLFSLSAALLGLTTLELVSGRWWPPEPQQQVGVQPRLPCRVVAVVNEGGGVGADHHRQLPPRPRRWPASGAPPPASSPSRSSPCWPLLPSRSTSTR